MKIVGLTIRNYKAIKYLNLSGLDKVVVIAGPNGCGKSCILDGIRLIRSAYGASNLNDLKSWFAEFHVNLNQPEGLKTLLQDKNMDMSISIEIEVEDSERKWLIENSRQNVTSLLWQQNSSGRPFQEASPFEIYSWSQQEQVRELIESHISGYLEDVQKAVFRGEVFVEKEGRIGLTGSFALSAIFGPTSDQIGMIDYHGPNRNYAREPLTGLTVNFTEQVASQYTQYALFNYTNKYSNIKSQLASDYVKELLIKESGVVRTGNDLNKTLEELFKTFFPDKEYRGPTPTPDGQLNFNVKTATGAVHDINDLSSGEKEVLYGYLRLRNSAPKNSVLLIDEPEIHLNPRLIRNLPFFYKRYIGEVLNNQLWLVTHSDTLLRHSTGSEGFSVFHMSPGSVVADDENQITKVSQSEEIERAVIDLVGDLASYKPEAKVVILEGGGDSRFDVEMISALFPEVYSRVNFISGGNKYRVRSLYNLLQQIKGSAGINGKFYSIT